MGLLTITISKVVKEEKNIRVEVKANYKDDTGKIHNATINRRYDLFSKNKDIEDDIKKFVKEHFNDSFAMANKSELQGKSMSFEHDIK